MYKLIAHTADMGIEASGETYARVIEESTKGLIKMIYGDVSADPVDQYNIVIHAADPVELLVSTLNEIVYQIETKNLVPAGLSIEFLGETELRGKISGEPFNADRHHFEREVKSVTYHKACIDEGENGFRARVYVDL